MTPQRFQDLIVELVDEDPFALRAVLKLLRVEYTTEVPTLAVTCERQPRLLVNLDFLRDHCRTDAQVKAVLFHEFLHVLLRHTETRRELTPERHLAFDAVINAIIHREHGLICSSMMSEYYRDAQGPMVLLRPPTPQEAERASRPTAPQLERVWFALYAGLMVADDIEALAATLQPGAGAAGPRGLVWRKPECKRARRRAETA